MVVLAVWIRSRCPRRLVLMLVGRLILLMVGIVVRGRRIVGIRCAVSISISVAICTFTG